ncbi:MAG TPA: FAD-dependent oxidoreductase [Streptosporangiaceae bacterium]|nr:FAD-dependent oxidoreductase [Streptosporangiaceae bacterium]
MTDLDADVLVLGAGVIGLSTAICLAEAGVSVTVAAADPPERTTSAAAGAIWGPHLVRMDERVERWAKATLAALAELSHPELGANQLAGVVHTATGIAASRESDAPAPEFAATSDDLAQCAPDEVPPGYASAWRLTATTVAMPGYLGYLAARFGRAAGKSAFGVTISRLSDASRLAPSARVIVNCTGCGARDLVPDPDVFPVRGQVVVAANPGITEFFVGTSSEPGDLTYLFPHGDVVVLGGTEQRDNWSLDADQETAAGIIAACAAIEPALRGARVLEHRVGLRPARSRVRLETEQSGDVAIVHNYGHGGSGVTLSWGCAEDAAELALAALARFP